MPRTPTHADVLFHRDPDLPGVEARASAYSERAFRLHLHPDYSVAMVETGTTTFELDGAAHRARAGQLVFVEPGKPHACNPDPDEQMAYRLFYIAPSWIEDVAADLGFACRPALPRPVVDDPELFDAWRALHVVVMEGGDRLEKESALVANIARTLDRYADQVSRPQRSVAADDAVALVREILESRITERVTLDQLAQTAGLSRYHLLRVFQDAVGLPPHAYQSQLRVEMARALLAEGREVSRVASECGFADQSHLTRVFREFTGATPAQYRSPSRSNSSESASR